MMTMDRSKWEYKKLGDICSKLTDGSHNPPKGIENSDYRMISSQNIYNDKIVLTDYRCLSKEDFDAEDKRTSLKKGDLLLTIVGAIGRCYVLNGTEGNLTLQRSVAALTPKDNLSSRFLMYYFIGNNTMLNEEAHGVAQKGIYLRQLSNLIVPVPTLDDQQRIVAELDCLNEMIALKQEQLKEFDKLAQSIFYDMFGDVLSNDRNWGTARWDNVLTIYNGRNQKEVEDPAGPYPICGSGGIMGLANNFICPENTIIIGRKGNINKPILMKQKFWNVDTAFGLFAEKKLLSYLYLYYFCILYDFEKHNKAVTIPSLTKSDLLKIVMPLPPLALQQQFAEKIAAIEAQKVLVKQSIAETQKLLDYTMDKYFGFD